MECVKHTRPLITERPKPTNRPSTFTPTYATPPPDNDYNNDYNIPDRKPETSRPPSHQTRPTTSKPTTDSYNNNCEWCFKCPSMEDKYYENSFDKV